MSAMEVKCPRCGSTWRVTEEKAGKKGRCPQCWGIIHVPEHIEPPPEAHHHVAHAPTRMRRTFYVGAAVALFVGIILTFLLRGGADLVSNGGDEELTPEVLAQIKRVNLELNKLAQIEALCDAQDVLAREERCLHARDVLRKDKAYEPVSSAEYALRSAVKEEEAAYRSELEQKQQPTPADWRLDAPLAGDERAALTQKSADLERQSRQIKDSLAQLGVNAPEKNDLLGRALVDTAAARKLLDSRRKQLQTTLSEVRSGLK